MHHLGTQELLTIPTSWQETPLQVFPPVMPLQFWIETLGSAHPSNREFAFCSITYLDCNRSCQSMSIRIDLVGDDRASLIGPVQTRSSTMNRFRRLLIRWDKKSENYLAFLHFACGLIAFRAAGLFG